MGPDLERQYVEYVTARMPRLHRTAYLLCADAFQADDVVQTTLTALYVNWKRAADADNLDAYVHRIMVRRYIDERRRGWWKVLLGDRVPRRRVLRRRSVQAAGGAAIAAAALVAPSILTSAGAQPARPADASLASTSSSPAGPCGMTELRVPSGMKGVTASAVDPTGKYVVGNSVVGQDFRPILWTDGQPQALPVPGKSVEVTAVNASGTVVGLITEPQQEYVFRYEKGVYTKLHTPPGSWHPYPTPAINAAGDIVINVEPSGNSEGKDSIVLLWKAGSTNPVKLPLPAGANAFDITDDGTIVGGIYKDGRANEAYAWDQNGSGRKLEVPAGQTTVAYAAQGHWVTGGVWPSMSVALWNLQTGEATTLGTQESGVAKPGTQETRATESRMQGPGNAVNASGWVVAGFGSVLRDGAAVELAVPTGQTSRAKDVSDNGLVVGQALTNGHDGDQDLGPRVWRC